MFDYLLKSVARHKTRLYLTFFLLMAAACLLSFSVQVLLNFGEVIESKSNDFVLKKELESVSTLITLFMGVLIGFSYVMINNTYSVILQGRIGEFQLLSNLGMYRGRIKRMLYSEIALLGTASTLCGTIIGSALSLWYMRQYGLESGRIRFEAVLYLLGLALPMLLHIVHRNFRQIPIGPDFAQQGQITKADIGRPSQGQGKHKKRLLVMAAGLILVMASLFHAGSFLSNQLKLGLTARESQSISDLMFWFGVLCALNAAVYLLLYTLGWLSRKFKLMSIYLAVEQNLYAYSKIKTLISSFLFATVLIVGMLGFYHSVRTSVVDYVDDHVRYSHVLISASPIIKSEQEVQAFVKSQGDGAKITAAISLEMRDDKNKRLLVTGINPDFFEIQTISWLNKERERAIFREVEDGEIPVAFPAKKAADMGVQVGDKIIYKLGEVAVSLQIEEMYKPLNLVQAYTSRSNLSMSIFGQEGLYNTLYISQGIDRLIDELASFLALEEYEVQSLNDLKREYKAQAIKGTEIIEAFLYINLLFTTSLIANMFLISFQDRIRQYAMLRILGTGKGLLLVSMLIEGLLVFLIAAAIGWPLGVEFVKGAVDYMNSSVLPESRVYIPTGQLLITLGACFMALSVCTIIIGWSSMRKHVTFYMYKG